MKFCRLTYVAACVILFVSGIFPGYLSFDSVGGSASFSRVNLWVLIGKLYIFACSANCVCRMRLEAKDLLGKVFYLSFG